MKKRIEALALEALASKLTFQLYDQFHILLMTKIEMNDSESSEYDIILDTEDLNIFHKVDNILQSWGIDRSKYHLI